MSTVASLYGNTQPLQFQSGRATSSTVAGDTHRWSDRLGVGRSNVTEHGRNRRPAGDGLVSHQSHAVVHTSLRRATAAAAYLRDDVTRRLRPTSLPLTCTVVPATPDMPYRASCRSASHQTFTPAGFPGSRGLSSTRTSRLRPSPRLARRGDTPATKEAHATLIAEQTETPTQGAQPDRPLSLVHPPPPYPDVLCTGVPMTLAHLAELPAPAAAPLSATRLLSLRRRKPSFSLLPPPVSSFAPVTTANDHQQPQIHAGAADSTADNVDCEASPSVNLVNSGNSKPALAAYANIADTAPPADIAIIHSEPLPGGVVNVLAAAEPHVRTTTPNLTSVAESLNHEDDQRDYLTFEGAPSSPPPAVRSSPSMADPPPHSRTTLVDFLSTFPMTLSAFPTPLSPEELAQPDGYLEPAALRGLSKAQQWRTSRMLRAQRDRNLGRQKNHAKPLAHAVATAATMPPPFVGVMSSSALAFTRPLGAGVGGHVWEGTVTHGKVSYSVAVKVAVSDGDTGSQSQFTVVPGERGAALKNEAHMLSRLTHPNIVRCVGWVSFPQRLVLELADGGALDAFVRTERKPVSRLLPLCCDVVRGVAYLHSQGVVHRDLAARNVLLHAGRAVVTDFGMAISLNGDARVHLDTGCQVALRWAAPEVAHYGRFSAAADMWATGVLLYEAVTRAALPYSGWSNVQVATYTGLGHRLAPVAGVPCRFHLLLLSCWHPAVDARPTAQCLLAALEGLVQDGTALANVHTGTEKASEFDYRTRRDSLGRRVATAWLQPDTPMIGGGLSTFTQHDPDPRDHPDHSSDNNTVSIDQAGKNATSNGGKGTPEPRVRLLPEETDQDEAAAQLAAAEARDVLSALRRHGQGPSSQPCRRTSAPQRRIAARTLRDSVAYLPMVEPE